MSIRKRAGFSPGAIIAPGWALKTHRRPRVASKGVLCAEFLTGGFTASKMAFGFVQL